MAVSASPGGTQEPLVTILTPTYNDAKHLLSLIHSVLGQTYVNWQWIIVDDGSSDDTPQVLSSLADARIRVLRKENEDQLNALAFALPYVEGEIIVLIHSDDEFVSPVSIEHAVDHLLNSGADGLFADFQTMDGDGLPIGKLSTPDSLTSESAAITILHMGTNFVGDPFFARRQAFDSHIVPNYISRNTIYYFDYKGSGTLRLVKTEPWYRYRVFAENYINSDIGKFVALSGQFRTVSQLVAAGVCPGLYLGAGYTWFRLARRMALPSLGLQMAPSEFGGRLFNFWARDLRRYGYPSFLVKIATAISHSYKVRSKQHSGLVWQSDTSLPRFRPADARRFYREYTADAIPLVCLALLDQGFDHVIVKDEFAREQAKEWLNFFSLQYPVVEQTQ